MFSPSESSGLAISSVIRCKGLTLTRMSESDVFVSSTVISPPAIRWGCTASPNSRSYSHTRLISGTTCVPNVPDSQVIHFVRVRRPSNLSGCLLLITLDILKGTDFFSRVCPSSLLISFSQACPSCRGTVAEAHLS